MWLLMRRHFIVFVYIYFSLFGRLLHTFNWWFNFKFNFSSWILRHWPNEREFRINFIWSGNALSYCFAFHLFLFAKQFWFRELFIIFSLVQFCLNSFRFDVLWAELFFSFSLLQKQIIRMCCSVYVYVCVFSSFLVYNLYWQTLSMYVNQTKQWKHFFFTVVVCDHDFVFQALTHI